VEPAVRALQGLRVEPIVPRQARLAEPVRSPDGRRSFLRANLDQLTGSVSPLTGQNSHQIASLARADSLIIVPESVTSFPAGQTVDVLELP
jgi:molybdopterin molybdotransferase